MKLDLYEISTNVVEAIPYTSFWDKIRIVAEEITKGRYVEVWDKQKLIYSAEKWDLN